MSTDHFTLTDWFGVFISFGGILILISALAIVIITALDRWN